MAPSNPHRCHTAAHRSILKPQHGTVIGNSTNGYAPAISVELLGICLCNPYIRIRKNTKRQKPE